jgi:Tol biopolymer transport system component
MSTMRADGTFGPGVRVAELSTAADDRMPNVRSDGLEIVFSSNRAGATAFDQDIYVATRANTHSPWSAPQRIANAAINTAGSETRSSLSADGTRLYFGRKTDAADPGDVFVATRERRGAAADGDASRAGTGRPALGVLAALLAAGAWLARRAMRA